LPRLSRSNGIAEPIRSNGIAVAGRAQTVLPRLSRSNGIAVAVALERYRRADPLERYAERTRSNGTAELDPLDGVAEADALGIDLGTRTLLAGENDVALVGGIPWGTIQAPSPFIGFRYLERLPAGLIGSSPSEIAVSRRHR
jgi:hypothetical protein